MSPRISIPAQLGCSVCIYRPHGILRSSLKLGHPIYRLGIGRILQFDSTLLIQFWKRIQVLLMDSLSPCFNQRIKSLRDEGILSNHYAAFPLSEKWKKRNLDVSLVASSAWVGGLAPVLLEEDASSSKRFLPAIARESFCCRCQAALLSL
ncbi:hypothetical protein Tco_0709241 [Tanacetum coccineum]